MLKKIFNVKKSILSITAISAVAAGALVYQNLVNQNGEKQISFEQEMVFAAKQYVENNQISIEKEIKTTAEYLTNTGDFSSENKCAEYSYVVIKNENGSYIYEPVVICEDPKTTEALNPAIGYTMESVLSDVIDSPVLQITNKDKYYSETKPTKNNVLVTITTNFPAVITSGNTGWTVSADKKTFTKLFEENGTETIKFDDENHEFGTPRTVNISVQNIDRTAPVITGVEDGKIYTQDTVVSFDEGNATLNGDPFTSGSTVTEGNYELIVTDEAGNESKINFTIDTSAPVINFKSDGKGSTIDGIEYHNKPISTEIIDVTKVTATYSFNDGEEKEFVGTEIFNVPGKYTITATDEVGHTSTKTAIYDNINPVLNGASHGKQYKDEKLIITIDDDSPVTGTYTLNGGEPVHFENSVEITEEGRYAFSATDAAGNTLENSSGKNSISFIIDRTAPTIEGVSDNGYYGKNENIKITFKDNFAAQEKIKATLTKPDGTKVSFASGTTLTENGTYALTVTDVAGNSSKVTFTIDKEDITVNTTQDIDTITSNDVTVTVTFNKPVKITSENANIFTALNANEAGYASEFTVLMTENGTVDFAFIDQANNTGTSSFTVDNIDKTAPTFVKGETTPAGLTNAEEVTVTVTFSEPVKITGENANSFTAVDAKDGYATTYTTTVTENTTINFSFEDVAGHTGTGSYTVTNIDRVGPTVTIISNGKREEITDLTKTYYYKNAITIRFADDREGTVIASYGDITPIPIINGSQIKADGTYTLNVRDAAGNVTIVNVVIDTKLPEVELSSGATSTTVDNMNIYGGEVTITVTDDTPTTMTATLNGEPVEIIGNTVSASGLYVLTVTDAANNSTVKTFRIDTVKPVIELSSEAESFTFNGIEYYSKSVSFKVTDDTNTTVSLTLNGEPVEITGNTVSASGVYVLTATDVVGNKETKTFAIDVDAPVITLTSENPVINTETMNYYSKSVTFKVTDDTNTTVTATLNGEPVEITGNTLTADGVYVLTATDAAGNKASETFTIDTTAPVLEGAAHGKQYKTDSLTINIKDDSPYTAT